MVVMYPKQIIMLALRCEIQPQINTFRARLPHHIICPISNSRVSRRSASIDHIFPSTFHTLVFRWLSLVGTKLYNLKTNITDDYRAELADRTLANSWTRYHMEHARLRALSRVATKALGRDEVPLKDLAPKEGR